MRAISLSIAVLLCALISSAEPIQRKTAAAAVPCVPNELVLVTNDAVMGDCAGGGSEETLCVCSDDGTSITSAGDGGNPGGGETNILASPDLGSEVNVINSVPKTGSALNVVSLEADHFSSTSNIITIDDDGHNHTTTSISGLVDADVSDTLTASILNLSVITGNAGADNDVLVATGANAANWEAQPFIDCTNCTNVGGAETNDLESVATSAANAEVFVGTGVDTGEYIAGLAACAADEKIEYTPGSPDTFGCEAIGGLVDADISDTLTASILNATVITGNASADNDVFVATGANAGNWEAQPDLDCTNCTNIPAASDLNDIGNVTLTTPTNAHVLFFTGTANASANRAIADGDVPDDITLELESSTLTSIVDDEVLVGTGAGTAAYTPLQNCADGTESLDFNGTAFVCNAIVAGTGNTYYVDATSGSDAAAGTEAAPWQTISKVVSTTLVAGDTVLFKRGEVWREQLVPDESGTQVNPITFGAYGNGAKPKILGSQLTTTWAADDPGDCTGCYSVTASSPINDTNSVWENGVRLDRAATTAAMAAGSWALVSGKVYVWATDGADPDTHTMEVGSIKTPVKLLSVDWLVFEDIQVQYGKGLASTLVGSESGGSNTSDHITLRRMTLIDSADVGSCFAMFDSFHSLIEDSELAYCHNDGWQVSSSSATAGGNHTLRNSHLHHIGIWNNLVGTSNGGDRIAIVCGNAAVTAGDPDDILIENNVIHDIGPVGVALSGASQMGQPIVMDWCNNVRITRNVLYRTKKGGMAINGESGTEAQNIEIDNNIMFQINEDGLSFNGGQGSGLTMTNLENVVVRDNLMYDINNETTAAIAWITQTQQSGAADNIQIVRNYILDINSLGTQTVGRPANYAGDNSNAGSYTNLVVDYNRYGGGIATSDCQGGAGFQIQWDTTPYTNDFAAYLAAETPQDANSVCLTAMPDPMPVVR